MEADDRKWMVRSCEPDNKMFQKIMEHFLTLRNERVQEAIARGKQLDDDDGDEASNEDGNNPVGSTAQSVVMQEVLKLFATELGRESHLVGRFGTAEFSTRNIKWAWHSVMMDFPVENDGNGNATLHRILGRFCKLRLGIAQHDASSEVGTAILAVQQQFRIDYTASSAVGDISNEGSSTRSWTFPILRLLQEHMRVFAPELLSRGKTLRHLALRGGCKGDHHVLDNSM